MLRQQIRQQIRQQLRRTNQQPTGAPTGQKHLVWNWALAGLIASGLTWTLLVTFRSEANAQIQSPGGDQLSVMAIETSDGGNVVVVDRQRQVLLVYRVDDSKSSVALRSVRNIRWDLMLEEFNTSAPRPAEVRDMVNQR
ncbi:MAG: hypothetical protein KDA60_17555 [Planctomycetales bacterium]|nr:hypothetical protein [Planctomycetales bacterium]